jgi:hypothetical protein
MTTPGSPWQPAERPAQYVDPLTGQPYHVPPPEQPRHMEPPIIGLPYTAGEQMYFSATQHQPATYQQAYPYQQPYPYQYPYHYAPPRSTNGKAIAAMVLGIVCFVGICSILALVFGYQARAEIRRTGQDGDGMAIAGIVLGWIGVSFLALYVFFMIVAAASYR